MSKDPFSDRFTKKLKDQKLHDLANKGRSAEEIQAEEDMIAKAEKAPTIHAQAAPGRNDPCPCGSGKKYKKCCGAEK